MIMRAHGSQLSLEEIKNEEDPTKEDTINDSQDESHGNENNQEEPELEGKNNFQ
jgi:hypothetical protein